MAGTTPSLLSNTVGALITQPSGTLATSSSSSVAPTITSIGNLITLRLTRDNFLLWKTQAFPALASNDLFGYVSGYETAPPHTITKGTGDAAKEVANPAFLRWYQQD